MRAAVFVFIGIAVTIPYLGCSGGSPRCGDGRLAGAEECDDGEEGRAACSDQCTWQEFSPEQEALGSSTVPSVSVSASGDAVVAFQSRDTSSGRTTVYGMVYGRNGKLKKGPVRLPVEEATDDGHVRVAAGPDGGFVAVWHTGDEPNRDVKLRLFTKGGFEPIGPEIQVNQHTMGDQYNPKVAWLPGGGAVVVWTGLYTDGDGRGVLVRRFDASGAPMEDEFAGNTYWENDQTNPAVAAGADGRFVVAWESKCQESG